MSVQSAECDRLDFVLPPSLEAKEPPEERGLKRGDVRMLVTHRATQSLASTTFAALPRFLAPGDVVVINTSGTIPAAIVAVGDDGTQFAIHLSTQLDDGRWVVEPRRMIARTTERWTGSDPPHDVTLRGGSLRLDDPYGEGHRLWTATLSLPQPTLRWLETHGRPIQYRYAERRFPLAAYQNVYALEYGSAEMPSAGRPFTSSLLTRLISMGVEVAPLVLHTGVSSLESDELPYPERVRVPALTAERVNAAHRRGGRVIAVGTTVVRALETSVTDDGTVTPFDGWSDRVISPEHGVRIVDGLITGWHEPVSSHLLMLEAIVGRDLLADSYEAALSLGYLWHEFGDSHLILP